MAVSFTFAATYLSVRDALDWLDDHVGQSALAARRDDIGIAAAEALTNVCRHAYGAGKNGDITLHCAFAENRCILRIEDDGGPPPERLFETDSHDTAGLPESGMGLPLIRALCSTVVMERKGETNSLTMTFAL